MRSALLDSILRRKPRLRHEPLPMPANATHRCPLCGREFSSHEAAACTTCPVARRCGLVMCPRCGYEFPPG